MSAARALTALEREVTGFLREQLARQGVPNPEAYSVVWEWAGPVRSEQVPDRDEVARRFVRALGEALDVPEGLLPPLTESGKTGE